jgi:hypothetical protein
VVRMDSAYYVAKVIARLAAPPPRFSVTIPMDPKAKAAIAGVPESAWTAIEYPQAIWDDHARGHARHQAARLQRRVYPAPAARPYALREAMGA